MLSSIILGHAILPKTTEVMMMMMMMVMMMMMDHDDNDSDDNNDQKTRRKTLINILRREILLKTSAPCKQNSKPVPRMIEWRLQPVFPFGSMTLEPLLPPTQARPQIPRLPPLPLLLPPRFHRRITPRSGRILSP